jgi:hypothetical protein
MKKFLILFLFVMAVASLTAQSASFLNDASYGLLRNKKDAAFSVSEAVVGPVFSSLDMCYLFAGLTNWYDRDTEGTNTDDFTLGLFKPAETPWSLYFAFGNNVTASALTNGVTGIPTTANVVVGTDTHTWVTGYTANDYFFHETQNLNLHVMYLTRKGELNLGVYGAVTFQNNVSAVAINTWMGNNNAQTVVTNYNTAAAGAVPAAAVDYTQTTTDKDPDSALSVSIRAPFYKAMGDKKLTSDTGISVTINDQSTSTTVEYSSPVNTAGYAQAGVPGETSTTDVRLDIGVDTITTISLPPIWDNHPDNRLDLSLDGELTVFMPLEQVDRTLNYDIDFAAAGAAQTITAYNTDTTITTTRGMHMDWSLLPSISHYFYYQLAAELMFAFAPSVRLGAGMVTPGTGYAKQEVTLDKVDVDANGTYDAADTQQTTTIVYSGNNDDNNHFDVIAGLTLPSSLRFGIGKLPFEVVLGNELDVEYTLAFYNNSYSTTVTTVEDADGTGAVTATATTTTYSPADKTNSRIVSDWAFANDFHLTLLFGLPADIELSVDLNMQNLLSFDNLRAELIIPLPYTPKASE